MVLWCGGQKIAKILPARISPEDAMGVILDLQPLDVVNQGKAMLSAWRLSNSWELGTSLIPRIYLIIGLGGVTPLSMDLTSAKIK